MTGQARIALAIGGAACVHDDIAAALRLFGGCGIRPDVWVAVNDVGIHYPNDHWATCHVDKMRFWLAERRKLMLPDPQYVWTGYHHRFEGYCRCGHPMRYVKDGKGGSSGLLAAFVALEVADKAVLAGIPMADDMAHFHGHDRGRPWKQAKFMRTPWLKELPKLKDRVRSMSGWTKELLGLPTPDWLGAVR